MLAAIICGTSSFAAEIKDDKDLFKAGAKLFRDAKYDPAIEKFSQAIKSDAKNPNLYLARGEALNKQRKYDKAIAEYDQAISLKPDFAAAYEARGVSYDSISDYDRAIADFEQSIKLDPSRRLSYFVIVFVDMRRHAYKHGIEYMTKLLKLKPKDFEAYRYRGQFFSFIHKKKEALSDLNKAVSLHPKDGYMYQYRARCYYKFNESDKALADNDIALKLLPDDAGVLIDRGMILAQKSEFDQALSQFDTVIARYPTCHQAFNEKAIVLAQLGRNKEANEAFDKAVQYDERHRNMYYGNHARTSAKSGNFDDALGDVQAMKQSIVKPKAGTAIDTKALEATINEYSKLIALNPKTAEHYYDRGVVYLCKNDFLSASLDFKKFLQISDWHGATVPYAVALQGVCLRNMKRESEATRFLDDAASKFQTGTWGANLVDTLRGKTSMDHLIAISKKKDKLIPANCFVGLWLIDSSHADQGKRYLQYVLNNGERSLDEYSLAASAIGSLEKRALSGKPLARK